VSQRGVGLDDVEIVECIGTEIEGGYLVRRKDVHAFEQQLKKLTRLCLRPTRHVARWLRSPVRDELWYKTSLKEDRSTV